jgi:hypothetical protein
MTNEILPLTTAATSIMFAKSTAIAIAAAMPVSTFSNSQQQPQPVKNREWPDANERTAGCQWDICGRKGRMPAAGARHAPGGNSYFFYTSCV